MMNRIILLLLLCLTISLPANAAAQDSPNCVENPVFNRFKGEFNTKCEQARFAELALWRWKNIAKPKDGMEEFKVEGEYWYYYNDIEKDASGRYPGVLEVRRNYENAVKQAKGKILLVSESYGRITYQISRPDGVYWGEAGCGSSGGGVCDKIMHKIIKTAVMEQSVVVTADQIAKQVNEEGKVVFYGIYFDTDQATLKKESAPTIAEMAKWLKTNAKAKVYIVGHTDMQGSKDHNLELSRNRAAAVVDELTAKHGIAASRLTAEGVGPLAPVSTNKTDAGKGKNRRVEMVLQ